MGTKLRALGAKHHKVGTKRLCNGDKAPLNGDKVLRVAQCNVALPIPLQVPCLSPPDTPTAAGVPLGHPQLSPAPKPGTFCPNRGIKWQGGSVSSKCPLCPSCPVS